MRISLEIMLVSGCLGICACADDPADPGSVPHGSTGSLGGSLLDDEPEGDASVGVDSPCGPATARCDLWPAEVDAGVKDSVCTKPRLFVNACTTIHDILALAKQTCAGGTVGTLQYIESQTCAFGADQAVLSCCFDTTSLVDDDAGVAAPTDGSGNHPDARRGTP